MKYLYLFMLSLFIIGCSPEADESSSTDSNTEVNKAPIDEDEKEELVVLKGKTFTQYYPGKKNIKFEGRQDEQKRRHGKWSYYSESGIELSTTMYEHGMKHGHMIVKYPNGAIYYHGEMQKDKKIGIWKTYNENGDLISETDFGEKE